jgi:hypothetical protein
MTQRGAVAVPSQTPEQRHVIVSAILSRLEDLWRCHPTPIQLPAPFGAITVGRTHGTDPDRDAAQDADERAPQGAARLGLGVDAGVRTGANVPDLRTAHAAAYHGGI